MNSVRVKKNTVIQSKKKANDKEPAPTLENQSENKELKECVTLWKNATVSEQREMVANTKKCP